MPPQKRPQKPLNKQRCHNAVASVRLFVAADVLFHVKRCSTRRDAPQNPIRGLDKLGRPVANETIRYAFVGRMMFGLIRTAILLMIAFVFGLFFERHQAADACGAAGGTLRAGVCWNE